MSRLDKKDKTGRDGGETLEYEMGAALETAFNPLRVYLSRIS